MGLCLGRSREKKRNDTNEDSQKSDYNKLLLEHLEKNKENFEVIAKSISALSAVNVNSPTSQARSARITSINETSCTCKCNCREHNNNNNNNNNNEAITNFNCTDKSKPNTTNKKNKIKASNLLSNKAHIRSINLISTAGSRTDGKHKRYLIEVSDSELSGLVAHEPNSSSSSATSSSSDLNYKLRSHAKDYNRNINKFTKLKSRTQNEIDRKYCDNNFNHYFDELNYLNYLACSANNSKKLKRKHGSNIIDNSNISRNTLTAFDTHLFNCRHCMQKSEEKIQTALKSKSTNSILQQNHFQTQEKKRKEVKLNKSQIVSCGTSCECNNRNLKKDDRREIKNFFKYDNQDEVDDIDIVIDADHERKKNIEEELVNNYVENRKSNLITVQNQHHRQLKPFYSPQICMTPSESNCDKTTTKLKDANLETNLTQSNIEFNKKKNSDLNKPQTAQLQAETDYKQKKEKIKVSDYLLDKLSITFSSFSSVSSSSSSTDSIVGLNASLSLSNSIKSFSSVKTLVQLDNMNKLTEQDNNDKNKISKFESSDSNANNLVTTPGSVFSLSSEKLKLQAVIDAVGFLLFPSAQYVNFAFKELLCELNLLELFQKSCRNEYKSIFVNPKSSQLYAPPCENTLEKSIIQLYQIAKDDENKDLKGFVKKLGSQYFKKLFNEYEKPLLSIGGTLQSFFNNLSSLHESLINHSEFGPRFLYLNDKSAGFAPSFRADVPSTKSDLYTLNIYTIQEKKSAFLNNFYMGLIESASKLIWDLDVQIVKLKSTELSFEFSLFDENLFSFVLGYQVKLKNASQLNQFISNENRIALDFELDDDLIKSTFPFTILLDRNMNIVQVGDSLVRHLGQPILSGHGCHFFTYFSIESPVLNEYTFNSLLLNQNMNFKLKMKSIDGKNAQMKDMEIKGSIVYENDSDYLLFLGSPSLNNLEELTDRGLYISDIPIHDPVRDIILVGEQTKAQEGLKFRMEKLKKSILQAHEDIEKEKVKNIELLNMIFPSEIAEKLWMGEKVNAHMVENVTLLYSDIVGFTAICSSAEPIEIVKMLKNIYTEFDNFSSLCDVYKIETIGDAYIVAAGLHKPSKYHAQRAAWMSLFMIDTASKSYTNKNEKIKMRIGLHTGDVLAGIVGIKQPRYCLFGNNCTITNKLESNSQENRIHVSPVTKKLLDLTPSFEMEPRSSEFLPDNWVSTPDKKETTWFLNGYKHQNIDKEKHFIDHIKAALNDSKENN